MILLVNFNIINYLSRTQKYLMHHIDYSKYAPHYESTCHKIIDEPQQSRKCTDLPCVFVYLVLMAGLIFLGIMEISEYNSLKPSASITEEGLSEFEITSYWGVIGIGAVVSVVTAFLYAFLIKKFPQTMVYLMMILSLLLLAVITTVSLIYGQFGIAIGTGVTLLIYLIILGCLWHKIKLGIVLIKAANQFITQKKYIFLMPMIKILMIGLFGICWVYTFNCIVQIMQNKEQQQENTGKQIGLLVFWTFMWLLNTFLFYYMMTFTIAVICANWYYKIQGKNSVSTAYVWMFRQIGSLIFGAFLISVVTLARMLAQQKRRDTENLGAKICMMIVQCCLKFIEDLLRVINHFTVIVFSVTGESYMQGAKSTMGLLFSELGLLNITNIICSFLVFWGLVVSIGIPCVLSYFYLTTTDLLEQQIGQVIGILIVVCLLTSTVVFETITESVSCMFIFYAMDKIFFQMNLINEHRFPEQYGQKLMNYSSIGSEGTEQNYRRM